MQDEKITELCKQIAERLKEIGSQDYLNVCVTKSYDDENKLNISYNNRYWDMHENNPLQWWEQVEE